MTQALSGKRPTAVTLKGMPVQAKINLAAVRAMLRRIPRPGVTATNKGSDHDNKDENGPCIDAVDDLEGPSQEFRHLGRVFRSSLCELHHVMLISLEFCDANHGQQAPLS